VGSSPATHDEGLGICVLLGLVLLVTGAATWKARGLLDASVFLIVYAVLLSGVVRLRRRRRARR
jgi:Flp pilus assembly protein TadB